MSAPPNVIENSLIAELVLSDEEDIVDTSALAQHLKEEELKNARFAKKSKSRRM